MRSNEPGCNLEVAFVAHEIKASVEVDTDPRDPSGIVNIRARALNLTELTT